MLHVSNHQNLEITNLEIDSDPRPSRVIRVVFLLRFSGRSGPSGVKKRKTA
jgi:hypothetical protein